MNAPGCDVAAALRKVEVFAMKFFESIFQILFVVALLGIVGCGEQPAPDETEESPQTTDTTEASADTEKAAVSEDPPITSSADTASKPADVTTQKSKDPEKMEKTESADKENLEIATLGGGCFWCTEAVMERLDGVTDVVSGYMGGHVENPTYEQVCGMRTGHAEVIQVTFNPSEISYADILDIFWQAHDPTTLNQQGADRGPQYRSAIFYHSPEQKQIAEISKKKLDSSGAYENPAVTEITEASTFWKAEESHQDYYVRMKDKNPYCSVVITPKMKKLGFE